MTNKKTLLLLLGPAAAMLGLAAVGSFLPTPPKTATSASAPLTQIAMPAAKPAYCADKASSSGLPECGWTAGEQRKDDRPSADSTVTTDQYVSQILLPKITSMCRKPVGQMTMEDIQDCNKPAMRALQGR